MESLIGYGSDDDYDDNSQQPKKMSSQADANYEEVQMDLSEESNDSTSKRDTYRHHHQQQTSNSNSDSRGPSPDRNNTKYTKRSSASDDCKHRYDQRRDDRHREKTKNGVDDDRNRREDRSRDYRSHGRSRDNRRSREDQDRYNKDERRSYRHRSRSRSPRKSDYKSRRSSSRDKARSSYSSLKRYDRTSSKMDRLEKLGIELNTPNPDHPASSSNSLNEEKDQQEKDRFYMPGITGRFTQQIQRRKLLWQKKDNKVGETSLSEGVVQPPPAQAGKVWQNTTFAQDTDGKVANKFKRLMGIRGNESDNTKPANELVRKQEEMFTSMEAQYEVARTATHTMRGVGLGFGSFQR